MAHNLEKKIKHSMNIALILSGGTGSRLGGDIPKQYIEVGGKPILAYCLETLAGHPDMDGIWIVADAKWQEQIREWMVDIRDNSGKGYVPMGFSAPGETRQLSIWNGLQGIRRAVERTDSYQENANDQDKDRIVRDRVDWSGTDIHKVRVAGAEMVVLIHDAARPLVSAETITACLEGCREHDGVMPALPVKDTVYYGADGRIESLLDRSKVIAGQAPEAFRFEKYYEANRALLPEKILQINGSTEPAVLAGMDVQFIPGDERNFKITTQADLERFREIVDRKNCV